MNDKIVFFDLETGGLDPQIHPVIQFAGIAVDHDLIEVDSLEVKVRFDINLCEPAALESNSYDRDTWTRDAADRWWAVSKISAFFREHATVQVPKRPPKVGTWSACQLAGYNAQTFDRPFLAKMFENEREFCIGTMLVLDVMQLALWYTRGLPPEQRPANHRLTTMCGHLGIDLGDAAHDAMADCRATLEVARALQPTGWR